MRLSLKPKREHRKEINYANLNDGLYEDDSCSPPRKRLIHKGPGSSPSSDRLRSHDVQTDRVRRWKNIVLTKTKRPESDIDLERVMEDLDALPDIVLNRPVGTSAPSHTSEALWSIDPTSQSLKQWQVETDNLLLQEAMDKPTSSDHTKEPTLLLGVTNDKKINQQLAELQGQDSRFQMLAIKHAATNMARELLHDVTNFESNIPTKTNTPEKTVEY